MTTTSFIIRLCFAVGAFNAANQVERPVMRAFGFAYLLIVGIFATLAAIGGGNWYTWVVGPSALAAAGYAFISNR